MTVGELIKKLEKLPRKMTVLKAVNDYSDYPYVDIVSVSKEKMLVNGEDIQLDLDDRDPGESQHRETMVVIK